MATVHDMLKAVNAYPVPQGTITMLCVGRELDPNVEATKEVLQGSGFRLAKADLLMWLSAAPNISQGGQNYSFSEDQRRDFRNEALSIVEELEPDSVKPVYGYKGSRL